MLLGAELYRLSRLILRSCAAGRGVDRNFPPPISKNRGRFLRRVRTLAGEFHEARKSRRLEDFESQQAMP